MRSVRRWFFVRRKALDVFFSLRDLENSRSLLRYPF